MSKIDERMKKNIQLERELAELAGQAGILSFKPTPRSMKDVVDSTIDNLEQTTKIRIFDEFYSTIPNPPKEVVEESEFLTAMRNNFSNPQVAISGFQAYIFTDMKNNSSRNKIMKIDSDRYFQFSFVGNSNLLEFFLVDERTASKKELDDNTLSKELYKLFEELHVFSEWKNYEDYQYTLYDTSYQKNDEEPETPTQKQERLKKIDQQYFKLKQAGFFTNEQLVMLYKIMHMDYDINCFACPLFSEREMFLLASIFSLSVAQDPSERPKLENFLRTFNEFCSNNFKHPFSFSEFGRLFTAANEGRLMEEINDPDFDLLFKLDYLIDSARDAMSNTINYNIGDKTFLITAIDNYDDDKQYFETHWKVELEDQKTGRPKLLFDSKIHELRLHSEPFSIFTDAYYKKHKIQDGLEYLNTCMSEIRKRMGQSSSTPEEIIELNNGNKLKIRGMLYTPGEKKIEYGGKIEAGCEIYLYKPNQKPQLVYSDNKAVTIHRLEKLSTIIDANGGINFKDKALKTQFKQEQTTSSSVADEILKKEKTNINNDDINIESDIASQILGEQNPSKYQIDVAQEIALMYQKTLKDFEKTKDTELRNIITLSNGNTIIFTPKKYFNASDKNDPLRTKPKYGVKVEIEDKSGKSTTFFDILTVAENGTFVPQIKGDLTKVAYYYRQVEGIQLTPDYTPLKQITNAINGTNKQKTNDEVSR